MPGFVHLSFKKKCLTVTELAWTGFFIGQFLSFVPLYLRFSGEEISFGVFERPAGDSWQSAPLEEVVIAPLCFCGVQLLMILRWVCSKARKGCSCAIFWTTMMWFMLFCSTGALWLKVFGIPPFRDDIEWLVCAAPVFAMVFILVVCWVPWLCRRLQDRRRMEELQVKNAEHARSEGRKQQKGLMDGEELDRLAALGEAKGREADPLPTGGSKPPKAQRAGAVGRLVMQIRENWRTRPAAMRAAQQRADRAERDLAGLDGPAAAAARQRRREAEAEAEALRAEQAVASSKGRWTTQHLDETGMAAVDTGTLIEALGLDFQVPARGTALQGGALHSAQCTSALRSGSRIPTRKLK
jgi:hypothetical protein